MAQCVAFAEAGASAPVLVASPEPCTSLVLLTPGEYAAFASNPFNLSVEDGALIASAVVSVWVVAFCVRALIRVLHDGFSVESES